MELLAVIAISAILYVFLPPLLDGIERKIKADIQSRYGPPTILQTWYDILKLLSKDAILSANPKHLVVVLSLSLSLMFFLAITLSYMSLSSSLDVFRIALVLITIASIHVLNFIIYILSSNPFSILGTFRIATIDVLNEAALATFSALMFVIGLKGFSSRLLTSSLAFVSLVIAVYVLSRRPPYDLHEAEPELASGSIIELSGPLLGLYMYCHQLERYVLTSFPIVLTLWITGTRFNSLIVSLLLHIATSVLCMAFVIISTILGRSRVNIAVKTLMFLYSLLIILWIGAYAVERIL